MRFDQDPSKEQAKSMKCNIKELKLLNRKMVDSKVANSVKSIPIDELGIQAVIIQYSYML